MSEPSGPSGPNATEPDASEVGDAPPAEVLDELSVAFGEGPAQSRPGEVSPSIIAESLVPEATRRSQRRSRREAKREAKQEAKRVAANEKDAKRAAKRARKAAKKTGSQPEVDVVDGSGLDDGSSVRIIEAAGPSEKAPAVPVAIIGEGLSQGSDQRSTVFIDDSGPGTGEIVTVEVATSAARMEPRMRERRIAVKRAVGRRRLKWVAIGSAVVAVVAAALAVLGSGLFAISTVEVEGAVYSRGDALDAIVADLEGANVLRVDTAAAEQAIEAIPWVEDADVTTDFPNGAKIEIRERRPTIAYLAGDGRYRVLDSNGRVLDVIAGRPVDYLELIVDDAAELEAGRLAPAGYRAAASLVSALTPQMRQRATSVSLEQNATELSLLLDDQIEVRFGAAEDLLDKLVRLQTALTNPDPNFTPTELIDVSTEDLIVR
jgi:cell division septal protein FtsQ